MFLITLATFDHSLQLTAGQDNLRSILLTRESDHPINNWNKLHSFMNINTYLWEDFELSLIAPPNTSQPWEIHTCWRQDNFMQVLLAVRPSLQNSLHLPMFLYKHDLQTSYLRGLHWWAKTTNRCTLHHSFVAQKFQTHSSLTTHQKQKKPPARWKWMSPVHCCRKNKKVNTMFTSLALLVISHLSSQTTCSHFHSQFFFFYTPSHLTSKNSLAYGKLSHWVLMLPRQSARCNGAHIPFKKKFLFTHLPGKFKKPNNTHSKKHVSFFIYTHACIGGVCKKHVC